MIGRTVEEIERLRLDRAARRTRRVALRAEQRKGKAPQQFVMQHLRSGRPLDGPEGTLAQSARPGDRLDCLGVEGGSFVNRGEEGSPQWVRLSEDTETADRTVRCG